MQIQQELVMLEELDRHKREVVSVPVVKVPKNAT
jgi:hypothetical protein